MVMEHAAHGSLLDFFRKNKPSISQVRNLCIDLCKTVEFLHCNYIVHRDLKLDNILITEDEQHRAKAKVSDFGFATTYLENNQIKLFSSYKGTRRGYMAPEIHETLSPLGQLLPDKYYDARKSDIFALGVILFCLVFGKLPFEFARKENKIYSFIKNKEYEKFWSCHQKDLEKLDMKDYSMV